MNENDRLSRASGSQVTDRPLTVEGLESPRTSQNEGPEIVIHQNAPAVQMDSTDARDQVRWGPLWAGVITALATFLLLEVAFFGFGWLTLGSPNPGNTSVYLMTALAGIIAFFAAGLVAAATAMWKGINAGLVQGMLVWCLAITMILVLSFTGAGALFGAFSQVLGQISQIQNAVAQGQINIDPTVLAGARDAARWALVGLLTSLAACLAGGAVGAKMWPRKTDAKAGAKH